MTTYCLPSITLCTDAIRKNDLNFLAPYFPAPAQAPPVPAMQAKNASLSRGLRGITKGPNFLRIFGVRRIGALFTMLPRPPWLISSERCSTPPPSKPLEVRCSRLALLWVNLTVSSMTRAFAARATTRTCQQ